MSEAPQTETVDSRWSENEALKRRVEELQADNDRLSSELASAKILLETAGSGFLNLLLNVPDAIAVVRPPEMVIELANAHYMEMIGNRDVLQKPLREALPEVAAQGIFDLLMRVYTTGEPVSGAEVFVKADIDGSGRLTDGWYDFVYQPMRDASGAVTAILCHVCDVTDKVLARRKVEALNEELRIFKLMADRAHDGIALATPEGTLTYANAAFAAMSGFGDHTVGTLIADLHTPEIFENAVKGALDRIREGHTWSATLPGRRPDGSTWMMQLNVNMLTDSAGAPITMTGIFRDVTAQHAREQKLRVLNALVESAPDGFAVAGLDRRVIYANPAAREMSGYGDTYVGILLDEMLAAEDRGRLLALVEEAFERGARHAQFDCERKDGSHFTGQVSIFVIYDGEGRPSRVAVIVRDVTEQIRADRERAELQQRLIESQEAALRELATPLVPLAEGVIAMPLVGSIDTTRARQIMETLLRGIVSQRARVALLDVTGVRRIDGQTADALLQSAKAAQLLGAEVVLTGLGPEVALTLVELGVDLAGIQTRGSLQSGIAYALGRLRGAQRA